LNFDLVCARDLMTKKIVMAEPHESLRTAVTRMSEHRIHGLLIRPASPSRGLSILTGKDCIRVICDAGVSALDDLCVEDAMTRPAVTVPAELCINDCLRLMRLAGVRTAPVLDRGELVGVLTYTDVLNSLRSPAGA
jgi:CBS domain-containing protein